MGYIFPLLTSDEIVQVLKNSAKFPDVSIDVLQKPQNYVTIAVSEHYYNCEHNGVVVGKGGASSSTSTMGGLGGVGAGHSNLPGGLPIAGSSVMDIYIAFWEFLTGTNDIRRIPWHDLLVNENGTQFPTLYEEAARFLCVFRTLQHLMQLSGISDFSMADLLKPEAKRLRRNLSALINFCRFREDESQSEHEQQRIVADLELKISSASESMRGLRSNVEQQEAELANERAAVERLTTEERSIKDEMNRLSIFQIEQGIDDAKREITETKDKIEQAEGESRMLGDSISSLRRGVISDMDPAKLVQEV
ncbi:unnamed protein product [Amoebophrya sp. A25]|nr:unnamed protein product [Amoebophrya sp. A25]|eukprot:GSA25T00013862001.1